VAVLAGLAGGGAAPSAAHAACMFVLVWHDRVYVATGTPETQPQPGAAVRGAVESNCNDNGEPARPPTPIAARRIAGVPPGVALLARDTALVASGYFPEVTNFLTGATMPTDETRGCALGGRVRIVGPAHPGFGLIDVTVDRTTVRLHHLVHGAAQMFPDGRTRFEGLQRNGLPYLGEGQRVRVDARFCRVPGSIGTKIVARRISPAGPIVAPTTAEDVLGADWRGSRVDAVVAPHGYGWKAGVALVLAAAIGALLILRRRSPRSGG
jgi:hypothetical protein